jgi:hypothetical protein
MSWIYWGSKLVWKNLVNSPKFTFTFLSKNMTLDWPDRMVIFEVSTHALIFLVWEIMGRVWIWIPAWTKFDCLRNFQHYIRWCTVEYKDLAIVKIRYVTRSMSCFATDSWTNGPHRLDFPHKRPLLHKHHKVWWHSHSTEHDTQPIANLISKQVITYQTRGGTCCSRVSTPKIHSFGDSSTTPWWY